MSKKILITGANGQLGREIQFIAGDYDLDFFFTDVDELDITDKEEVKRFIETKAIDCIVNCAAYTAVDKAEDDKEMAYKINAEAVENLAEAACGKASLIHISTDYVFPGTQQSTPLKEADRLEPRSVYGQSKLAGETILQAICPDSIIIRTSWLYSAYGNNFVKTMLRLGAERESLNVVCDQIGTPTSAADLARAILTIISGQKLVPGIYHYSNEGRISWFDFSCEIMRQAGLACKVHPVPSSEYPTRAERPLYSVLDKTKIKETFHLTIPSWEESLTACLARLKSN